MCVGHDSARRISKECPRRSGRRRARCGCPLPGVSGGAGEHRSAAQSALFESHKWIELHAGVSYILEYTSIDPGAEILEPALVHRLNQYVAIVLRPDERIVFSSITYYQPRFARIWSSRARSS
jgi:hypothetical protein